MSLQQFASQLANVNQRLSQRLSNFETERQTAQDIKSELISEEIEKGKLEVSRIKTFEQIGEEIIGGGLGISQLVKSKFGKNLGGKIKSLVSKNIKERIEEPEIDEEIEIIPEEAGQSEIDQMFAEMGEDPNIESIPLDTFEADDAEFVDALEEQPLSELEETSFGEVAEESQSLLTSTATEEVGAEVGAELGAEVATTAQSVGMLSSLGGFFGVGIGLATVGLGVYSAIKEDEQEDEIDDKYDELQDEYNNLNTNPIMQTGTLAMPVFDSSKFRQGITHF